ncbi:MAG TPA: hypothetical protein VHD57_09865 [Vicinamibacterales bacterium]|jgi:hypothetical protein|nr:hypothetical protein [Vicinamibacterales bacterium]
MLKRFCCGVATLAVVGLFAPTAAAQAITEAQIRAAVPYARMLQEMPGLTLAQYNAAIRAVAAQSQQPAAQPSGAYLGQLGGSPYAANSTSNPVGPYGSPVSPMSIRNPASAYGSRVSPQSATNPYATQAPRLIGHDGTYLGKLSANPYDPDSVSNPYGRYGSRYSPTSVNNPYGQYGSRYSPLSPNNPYTTTAPSIISAPTLPALPALPALPSLPALPTLPPLGRQ